MPCYAMQCNAMQCDASLCDTTLCYAELCQTILCCATLCYAVLCGATQSYTMRNYTIPCSNQCRTFCKFAHGEKHAAHCQAKQAQCHVVKLSEFLAPIQHCAPTTGYHK